MNEYQEEIVNYFGYWPAFCDAPILSYKRDEDYLVLKINYIDTGKSLQAEVEIKFHGISEVSLGQFEYGSVIDTMRILSTETHRVFIEPCYGFGGSFKCTRIQAKIVNA